jgi:hypothetical protein
MITFFYFKLSPFSNNTTRRRTTQKITRNDHFIVKLSQMLLHVSAYQHRHQGTHMILPWAVFHSSSLVPAAIKHIYLHP